MRLRLLFVLGMLCVPVLASAFDFTPKVPERTFLPNYDTAQPYGMCPRWSSYDQYADMCTCDSGFAAVRDRCLNLSIVCRRLYGLRAHPLGGTQCACRFGNQWNHAGTQCVPNDVYCEEIDPNSHWDPGPAKCVCNKGHRKGKLGLSCVVDHVGLRNSEGGTLSRYIGRIRSILESRKQRRIRRAVLPVEKRPRNMIPCPTDAPCVCPMGYQKNRLYRKLTCVRSSRL